ncbi:Holliday junction branch migration DNA helicase RuvB [Atribacter laminatus]|uniref:Holliday junction branch migration complex subunit RuvB n=1 Tax=Atribacter laminatus TaxID=2847778 RepID=A0A7T1AMN5_ATRLM|nr:Holliday junction branch migration DNA helicase RuvB [Atribacter laminatus]QPM68727.1 Holliday junction ATP-dependent DNA helicase RuvB [Atribacter laminatus]
MNDTPKPNDFIPFLKDNDDDTSLRPKRLSEFIGQDKVRANLNVFIQASLARDESLDHVILYGPPGLGKTTLASIIANEMNAAIRYLSGPSLTRSGDVASILTTISDRDVLFIDEVHRLPRVCEEILYGAMEDFALDILIGKGPGARSVRINLPPFTLIGATTRISLLSAPLRNRFGIIEKLDFYNQGDLSAIVLRSASVMNIPINQDASDEVARRSRGTPRIANRILKRVRDFAQYYGKSTIDKQLVRDALECLEIDDMGLNRMDRNLLKILMDHYHGGPVGINNLATMLGEDTATVEEVYEPFLIKVGLLIRTPRGRMITPQGHQYIKGKKLL